MRAVADFPGPWGTALELTVEAQDFAPLAAGDSVGVYLVTASQNVNAEPVRALAAHRQALEAAVADDERRQQFRTLSELDPRTHARWLVVQALSELAAAHAVAARGEPWDPRLDDVVAIGQALDALWRVAMTPAAAEPARAAGAPVAVPAGPVAAPLAAPTALGKGTGATLGARVDSILATVLGDAERTALAPAYAARDGSRELAEFVALLAAARHCEAVAVHARRIGAMARDRTLGVLYERLAARCSELADGIRHLYPAPR